MAITEKQKKFVEEYLIDLNATQAAIRAGYSVKNAGKIGHELLERTRISNEVTRKSAERSRRTGINADRVLIELAKIAFVNADDVIESKDATLKENASRDDLAAIQSIKLKALDMLGRHLGMWNDKLQVSGMEEEQKKLADILQQLRGDG